MHGFSEFKHVRDCFNKLFDECTDKSYDEHKIRLNYNFNLQLNTNLHLLNFTISMSIILFAEHNRLDFGALLKSIIGYFKSIIGSSLV